MENIDETLNALQSELTNLPDTFEEGDLIVAQLTPLITQALNGYKEEKEEITHLNVQKENLKKGIKDLSDNIMILANETVREFKPIKKELSEEEQILKAIKNGTYQGGVKF